MQLGAFQRFFEPGRRLSMGRSCQVSPRHEVSVRFPSATITEYLLPLCHQLFPSFFPVLPSLTASLALVFFSVPPNSRGFFLRALWLSWLVELLSWCRAGYHNVDSLLRLLMLGHLSEPGLLLPTPEGNLLRFWSHTAAARSAPSFSSPLPTSPQRVKNLLI